MSNINTATRRRQWLLTGGLSVLALAVAGGIWGYTYYQAAQKAPPKPVAADLTGGLVNQTFNETMTGSALTQQQAKTAAIESSITLLKSDIKQQNEALTQKLGKLDEVIGKLQNQLSQPPKAPETPAAPTAPAPSGPGGSVPAGPGAPAQWSVSGPGAGQGSQFYPGQGQGGAAGQGFYPGSGTLRSGGLKSTTFSYASLQAPKTKLPWIPSGSFSEAVLIEGADANASVTGSQNTSPVVITLLGEVSMPNGKTYNMDQCRVTGEMWGDISSERGEVRTKNISCILKNGQHIDMPFAGHVSYQGKQGIRGKPVMRNGKIIGYAGAAGFLSGIGEGIKSAATPVAGLGATASVGAGDVFGQGIGGGASKAADTLSQYWIKRAEQYHPVIDIGAGNLVTVVFQEGFRLETIEDAEREKEKPAAQATAKAETPQQAATSAVNAVRNLNPDEVLRQASQLKLGDTIQ